MDQSGGSGMGVGSLRCVVINVTDLTRAYEFWGAVTGLEVIGSETGWYDTLGYLGTKDPWRHEVILQRVDTSELDIEAPDPERPNPVHIDITPREGVDQAVAEILALGGRVKKEASLFPRPGSHGDHHPVIDWAVMQDPFGNEFCLVAELTPEQSRAAMDATEATTDREWRLAAGVTT